MTESNVPAIPDRTPAPIAEHDTDSWTHMAASVIRLAETIAGTPFVPKGLRDSVPATAAAMLYGREIGLPPMTSLQSVHVVEGRPGVSAERMRAMILAAGHELEVLQHTGAVCVMRGRRRGSDRWSPEVGWTVDMARAAGLAGKNNWKSYPRAMLLARATTDLARMVFPDVISGFRSVEELEDMGSDDGPAAALTATQEPATRVRRTRKTAAVPQGQAPALESPVERPATPPGPPLPGEEGYEETTEEVGPTLPTSSGPDVEEVSKEEGEATDDTSSAENVDPEPDQAVPPQDVEHGPRPASRAQVRMLMAMLGGLGVDSSDRDERLLICGTLAGRSLTSTTDLTAADLHKLIDTLGPLEGNRAKLDALLDGLEPHPAVSSE